MFVYLFIRSCRFTKYYFISMNEKKDQEEEKNLVIPVPICAQ